MRSAIESARSLLFVPGDRPERFGRAAEARADVVVIDLEDAVSVDAKDAAREQVERVLAEGLPERGAQPFMIRVNALDSRFAAADRALVGHVRSEAFVGVMVPKAELAEPLRDVVSDRYSVVALVETARGVRGMDGLACAPSVVRLALGAVDLALDLDLIGDPESTAEGDVLNAVRAEMVIASRVAGCAGPVDSVTTDVQDPQRTGRAVRRARTMGMTGKLCVHPRQVGWTHQAYRPSDTEVAWAREVLSAERPRGASALDGQMIDAPVVAQAQRLLALAGWSEVK